MLRISALWYIISIALAVSGLSVIAQEGQVDLSANAPDGNHAAEGKTSCDGIRPWFGLNAHGWR